MEVNHLNIVINMIWAVILIYAIVFMMNFAPVWISYQNALGYYYRKCNVQWNPKNVTEIFNISSLLNRTTTGTLGE